MAQHQAGPSSLKLAALSAYSYHLDSPPFTGTAGPLGENAEDYERFNLTLRDDGREEGGISEASGDNTPAAVTRAGAHHRERVPTSGSARLPQSSQGVMQEGLQQREEAYARHHDDGQQGNNGKGDTSSWDMEAQGHDRHSMAADGSSGHFLSNSLSPPPFSSSALGPLATSVAPAQDHPRTTEANGSRRRESSRPAFAQINSTTPSNEDGSSATTDADADVDADAEEGTYETEADGNPGFRSSIGTINGFGSKVPTQSQTKVSLSIYCMNVILDADSCMAPA